MSKVRKQRRAARIDNFKYSKLEVRNLLANFVVDSLADDASGIADGEVTLREAVIAAETNQVFGDAIAGDIDGDQIRFDETLIGQTITLTEGEFSISDDLSIFGGDRGVSIDADGASRIFNIDSSERILIRDVTLTGGIQSGAGGTVLINGIGETTLNQVVVSNSLTDDAGGGIAYFGQGELLIRGSQLFENNAISESGRGGALYVDSGEVRVFDSVFSQNAATDGGAIAVRDAQLTIVGSTIGGDLGQGNITLGGLTGGGDGAGIYTFGESDSRVTVSLTDIRNNVAAGNGGGIWNGADRDMLVRESTVSENTAQTAFAVAGDPAGGGGIYNDGGTLRVRKDSLVSLNFADADVASGGGIYSADGLITIVDSNLVSNVAGLNGGGLAVAAGQSFVARTDVIDNSAGSESVAGSGGGIYSADQTTTEGRSGIQFANIRDNIASDSGGGIFNGDFVRINIRESTISNNVANGVGGGGIYSTGRRTVINRSQFLANFAQGELGSGGGLYVAATSPLSGVGLVFENSVADGNLAQTNGGGIYLEGGRNRFVDSIIENNRALPNIDIPTGNGGGIYSSEGEFGATTSFRNGRIQNNQANISGGGLFVVGSEIDNHWSFSLGSTRLQGNTAQGDNQGDGGGAIFAQFSTVVVEDATLNFNSAEGDFASGAAILATQGADVSLNKVIASNNTASLNGGAMASINSRSSVVDSVLTGNQALNGDGGALYYTGDELLGTEMIERSQITFNSAAGSGGGVYWNLEGRFLTVDSSVIRSNTAGVNGGGLAFTGENFFFTNSIVHQNSAQENGGGIHVVAILADSEFSNLQITENESTRGAGIFNDGQLLIQLSVVSFNIASEEGGGIFDGENGVTSIEDTVLVGNQPE